MTLFLKMSAIVEKRLKELEKIEIFVRDVEKETVVTLQSLGWSIENMKDGISKSQCSFDSSHYVQTENIENHLKKCSLIHNGYNQSDLLFPDNCNITSHTVIIDPVLRTSVIAEAAKKDAHFIAGVPKISDDKRSPPLSADRMTSSFTRDERRAIYDYVVAQAPFTDGTSEKHCTMRDVTQSSKNVKSYQEELAETRDLKRRRTKYKVSTKSKTYSEVIREVIENQMDSYVDMINEHKIGEKKTVKSFNLDTTEKVVVKTDRYTQQSHRDIKHYKQMEGHKYNSEEIYNKRSSDYSRQEYDNKKKSKHMKSSSLHRDKTDHHHYKNRNYSKKK